MLKYVDYDIVFQEIPDEVTLAINLSNCPHRCAGCHSPHLREDVGETIDKELLLSLLNRYSGAVTCVCFMGGDGASEEVCQLAEFVREASAKQIKTAWYSGCNKLKNDAYANSFDYIKLGEYLESLGGLNKQTTNQRLYKIENGHMSDITFRMQTQINS